MKRIILASLLLLPFTTIYACSCATIQDNFLESLTHTLRTANKHQASVIKGEVISMLPGSRGIEFKVEEKFYGNNATPGQTIKILGASSLCWVDLQSIYAVGDELYLIVNKIDNGPLPGDYFVNLCGSDHVELRDGKVYGGSINSFTYLGFPGKDFEDYINKTIINEATSVTSLDNDNMVFVAFPNPTVNEWHILLNRSHIQVEARLYDITGDMIWERIYTNKTTISVNAQELCKGQYLLKLHTSDGQRGVLKLMK